MEGNKHINIEHPEAWELLVSIDDKQVDYILFTPSVAGSLIVGDVARTGETLQALEDALYGTASADAYLPLPDEVLSILQT